MATGFFVVLEGGLGNHLFQVAMGLAQCARSGLDPRDGLLVSEDSGGEAGRLEHIKSCSDPALREAANRRGVSDPLVREELRRRMHTDTVFREIGCRARALPPGATDYVLHRETDWNSLAPPAPPAREGSWVVLGGYFQSEGHWPAEHREAIVGPLAKNIRKYAESVIAGLPPSRLPSFSPESCIAVHVRRGDYLRETTCAVVNADTYYPAAMRELERAVAVSSCPLPSGAPRPPLLVFTNDREWCERRWAFLRDYDGPHQFVDTGDDVADMHLMSRCAHAIIANSTFSWWGAYLGANYPRWTGGKVVVAPKQWFGARGAVPVWSKIYAEGWLVV